MIQRLMEHFASGAVTLKCERSFHAVRIVVSAAMVCIADAILRKSGSDFPSSFSTVLAVSN